MISVVHPLLTNSRQMHVLFCKCLLHFTDLAISQADIYMYVMFCKMILRLIYEAKST